MHTPKVGEGNILLLSLSLSLSLNPHPFIPCCYNAFRQPRVLPLHPIVRVFEGRVTVTDLSSVPRNRTTGNFAFEGLNMHKRQQWVKAVGRNYCVTLSSTP